MQRLHVGSGTSRGALTVLPVWGEYAGPRGYRLDAGTVELGERSDGPVVVGSLRATNGGDRPVLMLEGQVLEGGWQHRLLGRSVLVPQHGSADLDVACVEAGRWGGAPAHAWRDRRASLRVRTGLHDRTNPQGEVWRRVAEYDARYGPNATSSYAEHADRAEREVRALVRGLRPLPGQAGVVVAIAGHPVALEVFDSPLTLVRSYRSLVGAAAMDAFGHEEVATPSRRARRFVEHVTRVRRRPVAPAGLGTTTAGGNGFATVTGLTWRRRDVHLVATNPCHPLTVQGGH